MAKLTMRVGGKQHGTGVVRAPTKADDELDSRIERVLTRSEAIPPAPKMRDRLLQMKAAGKLPWLG